MMRSGKQWDCIASIVLGKRLLPDPNVFSTVEMVNRLLPPVHGKQRERSVTKLKLSIRHGFQDTRTEDYIRARSTFSTTWHESRLRL